MPPWRQHRDKSSVILPQMLALRRSICVGVDYRNYFFAPELPSGWIHDHHDAGLAVLDPFYKISKRKHFLVRGSRRRWIVRYRNIFKLLHTNDQALLGSYTIALVVIG